MDRQTKLQRLSTLEREASQLRAELGMAPDDVSKVGLGKREALLLEAERIAHLGSWTWDLRTGQITWSDEFYRILGFEPNQIPASSDAFFAAVHPEDRERLRETAQRDVPRGETETVEFRIVRPDGEVRHVRMNEAFVHDADMPKAHLVGTLLDETDKVRTADLLKRAVEDLREAHRIAALGSWRAEVTGKVEWSDGMFRLFGISDTVRPSEELFYRHVHPDDAQRVRQTLEAVTGETLDFRIVRPDGTLRDAVLRSRPMLGENGQHIGCHGIVQDITERKAIELQLRQSQKMDAIGTLAGGVAHDFNNYLMVLGGHIDLLAASLPPEHKAQRSLEAIRSVYERCVALTQQLLTLSRKRQAQLRPVDLAELVTSLAPMLRSMLDSSITVNLDVTTPIPPIMADPDQLEQALMNLTRNARDAMPAGGELTFLLRCVEGKAAGPNAAPHPRYARLSVRDTGSGIPEELHARVFEPFFTTKPVGKGTGLGLSAVYGIVQDAGGRVDIESKLGHGTAVHLLFPCISGAERDQARAVTHESWSGRGQTILLVEDVDLVRELVETQLRTAGYRVLTASDGVQALKLLEEHPVDAVISDVVMPGMGGLELSKELLKREPPVPCLLITGYSADTLRLSESELRVPLLRKPFTTIELTSAVSRLLSRRATTS